jgi:hypothetical protein
MVPNYKDFQHSAHYGDKFGDKLNRKSTYTASDPDSIFNVYYQTYKQAG